MVIPSSAGSIMRSTRYLRLGEQTVRYFLLKDFKYLIYKRRPRGVKDRQRGESKGEGHTHEGTPVQEITRVGHRV